MRTIHVALADSHAGHRLCLANPSAVLGDDDPNGPGVRGPSLTKFQHSLYDFYAQSIDWVRGFAKDDPVVVSHAGDLTHGNKYVDELMCVDIVDQIRLATANLRPWLTTISNVEAMRLVLGTGVHTLGGGTEKLVAERLRLEFPDCDIKTTPHSVLTIGGATFDAAHHGPSAGKRKWLEGNVGNIYLRDTMLKLLHSGKTPPKVFLRAHRHIFIPPEFRAIYFLEVMHSSWLLLLPPMCGLSSHARKVAQSPSDLVVGMWVIEILDGKIARVEPLIKRYDLRRHEVIGGNRG